MILGQPMKQKYSSNEECEALKAELRLQPAYNFLLTRDFIRGVVEEGRPFFGYEPDPETHEWKRQTLVGVDFDHYTHCTPREVVNHYKRLGFNPWFAYQTFSGPGHFRLIFKVVPSKRFSIEDWHHTIKLLQGFGGVGVDKAPTEPTRCWQGSYGEGNLIYLSRPDEETLISPDMFNINSSAVRGKGTFKADGIRRYL